MNGDWNVDGWRYDWVLDFDIYGFSIDWAVEKHREGDDAQAQGQHGKDETDPGAESDQLPALRRVEDGDVPIIVEIEEAALLALSL